MTREAGDLIFNATCAGIAAGIAGAAVHDIRLNLVKT
jgi:hypothetical protein